MRNPAKMNVIKRNGQTEPLKFDKITTRITRVSVNLKVDPTKIALQTIKNIQDNISTELLDRISAKIAESMKIIHPDYSIVAGRLAVSNLHKSTSESFSKSFLQLDGIHSVYHKFVNDNAQLLDDLIVHERDYKLGYYGLKVLEGGYMLKDINKKIIDRPQYVYMREAITVSCNISDNLFDIDKIKETYDALSLHLYTHASPTMFTSCFAHQQLSSCFLLGTQDTIEGIMQNVSDSAIISKKAGGIGIHMHNIRPEGSLIKSTGGKASGLPPQLKIYNEVAKAFDQGGRRPGAISIYLELWHNDIISFLQMKLQHGDETRRARDLFYAVWVCDLFIHRIKQDSNWSLFDPNVAIGLCDVYDGMPICECGFSHNQDYMKIYNKSYDILCELNVITKSKCDDHVFRNVNLFTRLYEYYENKKLAIRSVKARTLLDHICKLQRDSGMPYVCFKDTVNRLSNQSNIGTIKSSNLCTEIMEWSNETSYASCTLASINLRHFVKDNSFDFDKLQQITKLAVRNLDNVINNNDYPIDRCKDNAYNYRPIAVGIQGLADLFCDLNLPYLSEDAEKLDIKIAETIYFAALTESCDLARKFGPYKGFDTSPAINGKLQFDLWLENNKYFTNNILSGDYNWCDLKNQIKKYGLRNSLLLANMPTVSTSQIMNTSSSFEPLTNLYYTKTTINGKITMLNTELVRKLYENNLWNENIKNQIINNGGSISNILQIPTNIRSVYQTVWDMPQSKLIQRAALRNAFIDQSQSLNIHLKDNSDKILKSVFMLGHEVGLKTGSYYIRTQPASEAMKINTNIMCTREGDCVSCSS